MADITLQHMTNGQNISVANNNFDKLQDNINNHSIQKDGGNNVMSQDLDLNGNRVLNVHTDVTNPASLLTVGAGDTRYYQQHNVGAPSVPLDATNKAYVDAGDAANYAYTNLVAANFASGLGNFVQAGTGAVSRTFQDKLRDQVSVKDFGAKGDGITNDINSFVAAITALESVGGGVLIIPSGTYKLNSGFSIDAAKTLIKGDRAKLDFSGVTSGTCINIFSTATNSNTTPYNQNMSGVRDIELLGSLTTGVIGIYWQGIGSTYAGYANLQNVGIYNFDICARVFSNAWSIDFYNCSFLGNLCFDVPSGGTNYGERLTFIGCWFNQSGTCIQNNGPNTDIMLLGCSINYSPTLINCLAGTVTCVACHLENNITAGGWFKTSGDASKIILRDCSIVINGSIALTNYIGIINGNTSTKNQLVIEGGRLWANSSVTSSTDTLFGGTANIRVRAIDTFLNGSRIPIAMQNNRCPNYSFEDTSLLTGWTLSGSLIPAISTDFARTGTKSLKFSPASGQSSTAVVTLACTPGSVARSQFYTRRTLIGNTFTISYDWLNSAGTVIKSETSSVLNTDSTTFALNALEVRAAPAGTSQLRVTFNTGAVSGSGYLVYLDDVYIELD